MDSDQPKNEIKDESDNEAQEKSENNSDNEEGNEIEIKLNNKSDKDEDSVNEDANDDQDLQTYSNQCDLLKMPTVPTFGKYSKDYTFLEQILILKSNTKFENIPPSLKEKIENLHKKYPNIEPEYFQITLGNTLIKASNVNELNNSYECLNLLCHPYIFYNCALNQEHKTEIYCSAFTDENEIDTIKQGEGNDILRLNPDCNLDDNQLKRELILHLSQDGYASLSPNNCAILINLNAQIINFYVVVCGTYGGQIVKCFVGNYIIIPNAQNSVIFGDLYEKIMKDKKKNKVARELINIKNKFREYMNYIFNFGINEIVKLNENEMENVKLCIMKAFSFIFDFASIEDDENSKKIHEKELINMQTFYYYNFLNFITNLYENGSAVDVNFGKEIVQSSLKNEYIEELLVKYRDYNIKRISNIISNYGFFIYENEDDYIDMADKTNQKFDEEILPNLKEFFSDKLNMNEENLDKLKDSFNEENRERKDNPNIETLINICNSIRNGEDINNYLNQLDGIIKRYLYYIVWDYKGRPMGIDNNFGELSFINSKIDGKYYCNKDDQINCCQKIIHFLEEADKKNYN